MPMTQEERECALDEMDAEVASLDDEFPAHISWSIYQNSVRLAVAANEHAARFAAMLLVDRLQVPDGMTMVGPRIENGVNIGVRIPLFASAIRIDRHRIAVRYHQMRIAAAVDDMDDLIQQIKIKRCEAADARHAIDVLMTQSPIIQLAGIAAWTAERFNDCAVTVKVPRDYVLLDGAQ